MGLSWWVSRVLEDDHRLSHLTLRVIGSRTSFWIVVMAPPIVVCMKIPFFFPVHRNQIASINLNHSLPPTHHTHLNLLDLPQSSQRRSHGGGSGGPAQLLLATISPPSCVCSSSLAHIANCVRYMCVGALLGSWLNVRYCVSATSDGLAAALAVPDTNGATLDGDLTAEGAFV